MASIKPFKAIRYNSTRIKELSKVVAPPYDIISSKMQEDLHDLNSYNIVRLIFGRIEKEDNENENRYTRSSAFFDKWLADTILDKDKTESLYIYSQEYKHGNKRMEMIGFIGLLKLGKGKKDRVLPHENTLLAPKTDRLNLIRRVKSNLSPIFVLYDDRTHGILNVLKRYCSKNRPIADIKCDDVRHRMWRMDDEKAIKKVQAMMGSKEIFIADGHHRYEVACTYAEEAKRTGADFDAGWMMVYFVDCYERMLTVLPAHRLIKDLGSLDREDIIDRLKPFFRMEKVGTIDKLMGRLARLRKSHVFGMYTGKGVFYLMRLKDVKQSDKAIKNRPSDWKRLDVSILHFFIFQYVLGIRDNDDNIEFVKSPSESVRLIDEGPFKAAFFLNPTKVAEVKRMAKLGERMPRKATYFYPKPLSGLVINKF